eukprot:4256272-Prymnesium_polylepis.1
MPTAALSYVTMKTHGLAVAPSWNSCANSEPSTVRGVERSGERRGAKPPDAQRATGARRRAEGARAGGEG